MILSAGALGPSAGDSAPDLRPHLCRSRVPTRCPPVNILISSVKTRCSPVTEEMQHKWKWKYLKFRCCSFDLPSNEAQHVTFSASYFNRTIIRQSWTLQVSVGPGLIQPLGCLLFNRLHVLKIPNQIGAFWGFSFTPVSWIQSSIQINPW